MHKILVVEDEESITELLKFCLEDAGYLVVTRGYLGKLCKSAVYPLS